MYYDLVVIGAGIAGLTVAHEFRQSNCVILEKQNRIGGRIFSPSIGGAPCDLGATIGYKKNRLPFELKSSSLIHENGDFGIFDGGRLIRADNIRDALEANACLKIANSCETSNENLLLSQIDTLSLHEKKVLQTLFNVTHPGPMEDYAPKIWIDAFHRYYPTHREHGNEELAREVARDSTILLNTEVVGIDRNNNGFSISVLKDGCSSTMRSKMLAIATDAETASQLMFKIDPQSSQALSNVRYGSFVTCGLAFGRRLLGQVTYVITPDLESTVLLERSTRVPDVSHITVIFADKKAETQLKRTDPDIVKSAITIIRNISGDVPNPIATHVARWKKAGTIISSSFLSSVSSRVSGLGNNVAFAGDYLHPPFFGMEAAVKSALAASRYLTLSS